MWSDDLRKAAGPVPCSNLFMITDGKFTTQLYYAFSYDVTATCDSKLFDLPTAE